MGFLDKSLERGISLKPDIIACDAGSTDSGETDMYFGQQYAPLMDLEVR